MNVCFTQSSQRAQSFLATFSHTLHYEGMKKKPLKLRVPCELRVKSNPRESIPVDDSVQAVFQENLVEVNE